MDQKRSDAVAKALEEISSDLAGVFRHAVELIPQIENPGIVSMVAHAGRELSTRVVGYLADDTRSVTEEEYARLERDREKFRLSICEALGLAVDHPIVAEWSRLHKVLVSNAHVPATGQRRDPELVATAFEDLSEFLYARLANYFEARAELLGLLNESTPSEEIVQRAGQLLSRPALRRFFFERLSQPGWLGPLVEEGLLSRPSPWDGSPGVAGRNSWPEGGFLVRMAKGGADVERIGQALQSIPASTENPLAWPQAAEAAIHLPLEVVRLLVPRFLAALDGPFPFIFPSTLSKLAVRFALAGESKAAFRIAGKLLSVRPATDPATLPDDEVWIGQGVSFRYFDHYEAEDVLAALIPALIQLDPEKAIGLLVRVTTAAAFAAGTGATEQIDGSGTWEADPKDGSPAHSANEQLVRTTLTHAVSLARQGPEQTRAVLEHLGRRDVVVIRQIFLRVLAEVGSWGQPELDGAINDTELDSYVYEDAYGDFLRAQFNNTSDVVREEHIRRVLRSHSREDAIETLKFLGTSDPTESDVDEWLAAVQVRLIERLGDPTPPELVTALERQRSVIHDAQTLRQEARPEKTPSVGEDLAHIDARELPDALAALAGAGVDDLEERDVASVIRERVGMEEDLRTIILSETGKTGLPLRWILAVLLGLEEARARGCPLGWPAVLGFGRETLLDREGVLAPDAVTLEKCKISLLGLFADAADANALPEGTYGDVLDLLLASASWFDEDLVGDQENMRSPEFFARGTVVGQGVRAAIALGLFLIRRRAEGVSETPDSALIISVLESAMETSGSAGLAARVMVARYLPWLLLIDRGWVESVAPALFPDGFIPGGEDHAWRTYLRMPVYESAYEVLRSAYAEAVTQLGAVVDPADGDRDTPAGDLAGHIVWLYLRGVLRLGEDGLIEGIFQGVTSSVLGRIYWGIYRSLTDLEGDAHPAIIPNLITLWEWRVSEVRASSDDVRAVDEAVGLGWLFQVELLDPAVALPLLRDTLERSRGDLVYPAWERLALIQSHDLEASMRIAELLVGAILQRDHPRIDEKLVPAVLKALLSGDATRERAVQLVHDLGEAGFDSLDQLFKEPDQDT